MRRPLCLLATLALCGWLGCKDKDKYEGTKTQSGPNLDQRCERSGLGPGGQIAHQAIEDVVLGDEHLVEGEHPHHRRQHEREQVAYDQPGTRIEEVGDDHNSSFPIM